MSLNLTIQGDADGLRRVADWLIDDLAAAADDSDYTLMTLASDATYLWSGAAGLAFNATLQAARRETADVPSFVKDLAEVMHAYASRLERGQEYFDEVLQFARDNGLSVVGVTIHPPQTSLLYCPGSDSPPEEVDEYHRFVTARELYERLGKEVGEWEGSIDAWIQESFGPLLGRIAELADAAYVLRALESGNTGVVQPALEYAQERRVRNLQEWRDRSQEHKADYEEYKADRRSGHPARRAAAAEAIPHELRTAIDEEDVQVARLARFSRVLPGIGYVADAGIGAYDIANGGSPGSVLVETSAGIGGGAVAAGLAGSGPIGWTVGAAVVGGYAVGKGGVWLYEHSVALENRDGFDEWFLGTADAVVFWDDDTPRVPQ